MTRPHPNPSAMQLVATPSNPVPPGATLPPVVTEDGLALRCAVWQPAAAPCRGTVCVLQGRTEFVEKYFETVGDLRRRGFAVVAFDWRGQGLSAREVANPHKGHVRDFALYRRDLEAVFEQVIRPALPAPYFALAHSMGAAVTLLGAREGWLPFARVVALAPMIALKLVSRPRLAAGAALALSLAGLSERFIPGGREAPLSDRPFAGNRLTGDPARYARNAETARALGAGAVGDPTIGWVRAAFRAMHRLADPSFPSAIRLPFLILAAGADPVCDTAAIERFAARLKAGHALVIPGARHELLMETDPIRDQVWAAFDAFIPGEGSPREQVERGRVEALVTGGDD